MSKEFGEESEDDDYEEVPDVDVDEETYSQDDDFNKEEEGKLG